MSKNTKGKKDTKTTEVDPQSLFQQFAPALHFEEPKLSSKDNWYIVGEQVVPVTRDAFWGTIVIKNYMGFTRICINNVSY